MILVFFVGIVFNLRSIILLLSLVIVYDMVIVFVVVDILIVLIGNFQYLMNYSWVMFNVMFIEFLYLFENIFLQQIVEVCVQFCLEYMYICVECGGRLYK